MKIRNPIYLPLAVLTVLWLALAHHRGWSLLNLVAAQTWQRSALNTQHK